MANQYTIQLTALEANVLHNKLRTAPGFCEAERAYAAFCYEKEDVNVAYFPKKGKLLIQGKGTQDFLENVMLRTPGYDLAPTPAKAKKVAKSAIVIDKSPHFGVDESGKGDYFGPLVVAGVYSDERTAELLRKAGCMDSKQIPDDKTIHDIAEKIKTIPGVVWEVICIGPRRYNELYAEIGNLNKLLAWAHARTIAALHEKMPTCPRALSDQFAANEGVLQQALNKRYIPVQLEQRTRAESDIAVAAASILARDRFVQWMQQTAKAAQCDIPLGCAPHVVKAARAFVSKHGKERLQDVAKLHFKVTKQVIS